MGLYNTPNPLFAAGAPAPQPGAGLMGLFGGGQVPGVAPPQRPGMPPMPQQAGAMPQQAGAMSMPYLAALAMLLQRMGGGGAPFGMGGGAMPGAPPGAQPAMPIAPRPILPPQVR